MEKGQAMLVALIKENGYDSRRKNCQEFELDVPNNIDNKVGGKNFTRYELNFPLQN